MEMLWLIMKFGIGGKGIDAGEDICSSQPIKAEELGFDRYTCSDTQCNKPEVFTKLAIVADRTSDIEIGPSVTNPITRHPTVTASSISTIDEISGGRAFLGFSSGDSAVRSIGEKPAKLSTMEQSIKSLKPLMNGEQTSHNGTDIQLEWINEYDWTTPKDIPIVWACEGPKTQRLAGRYADGVKMGLGILPDLIEEQVARVREGSVEAGRDPDEVEIWVNARCNIADDRNQAINELKGSLASIAHHSLKYSLEKKGVPDKYKKPIKNLTKKNLSKNRDTKYNSGELVDELGLTEYLADRYAIVGTVDDCIEKISEIEETGVVDGVKLGVPSTRRTEVTTRFGEEVMPSFR